MGGLRLALSLFTVLPVRADRFDRPTARVAMLLAPLAGGLLGLILALAAGGLVRLGAAPLLGAAVLVALALLLTRGLHIDGLADTADGLGSYADAGKALEIMKKSDIGPFGVAAIAAVLLVDAAAAASLVGAVSGALVLAFAAGRLGATVACRRGLAAARPEGLGALVADLVPGWALAVVAALLAALGALVDLWRGPLAVVAAVAVAWALTAHARRRLGGLTGDVIGASIELATAAALIVLAT
ncbi:adenosylcobinamide-GDP ribazoletransferase [Dactylosporangium matsuzakiense]|uniref:Adenosylcobinamide-GDP ribazoletransferase n=1 Tax=Dactylosporangium matsuzakiense TaxID=53360 RepID=A0A9W6KKQ5_9ACTN|nr:adenosylcobinamide-GDP ribazoletransferase [Dactylosporangium matsuzakiense]UWZ43477.1 adenosylcobinamide-GDP ribazoletransferase [Dactylosporangium matsuzakiense]GLL02973.1 adenosylcobinamide-GDP ribazoletransferase [Dactylosporangium matsuzakiense]